MRLLSHILLLAITALIAWGSDLRLVASLAVVAGIACLGLRPVGGHWVRAAAFLGAVGVVVATGLMVSLQGYVVLVFVAMLPVQIVALGWLSALGPDEEFGPVLPTLAFYAALVGGFLAISGIPADWSVSARIAIAAMLVAAGVFAWRAGDGAQRFRKVDSMPRSVASVAGFVVVLLLLTGLLLKPLPWAGEQVVTVGEGVRSKVGELVQSWRGGGTEDKPEQPDGEVRQDGSDGMEFGRRRELPERAELQQSGEPLVHLEIPDRAAFGAYVSGRNYLRSWVLEQYTENGWEEPAAEPRIHEDVNDGAVDGWTRLREGRGIKHRIYLPEAGGAGLPTIQNPLAFRLGFVFESAPDMYEAELRGSVFYEAESAPLHLEHFEADDIEPGQSPRRHLLVTAGGGLGGRLSSTVASITSGIRAPAEKLSAIKTYLRSNCRYGELIENPDSKPPMENFLYGERIGWCDFFATAAVLMAREAGFPARMAYGFSGGQSFVREQVVSYREKDAHAWAEIYIEGAGWVVFDTTPPGSGASKPPKESERAPAPNLDAYRPAEDGELEKAGKPRRTGIPDWLMWAVLSLAGIVLVAMIVRRILANRDDSSGDRDRSRDDRAEAGAPAYLREFLRLCREFGRAKPAGETLRESIAGLRAAGLSGAALTGLAQYHYGVRYEDTPRDRSKESELRRELKRMRKELD